MAGKHIDLLRMRLGSAPSITSAITRPSISFLHTPFGSLRLRDSGGVSLPTVVFACDAPNVLEHYDAIYALLASSYRLICLEMPGFGFSYPSSAFDFTMRKYVDVVVFVLERLGDGGGKGVTLMFPCAWSYVAFQLAAEQPTLVERLIVSQCPCWEESQAWSARIDSGGMMRTPVFGQLFMAMNQKRVSDGWYAAALPKGRAAKEFADPARKVLSDGGIFCLASLFQTWGYVKSLPFLVEQPTVVMWGASDRTHRHSNAESVLRYLKRGLVLRYPQAGHFPELEDPEVLKTLLADEELWSRLEAKESDPEIGGASSVDQESAKSKSNQLPEMTMADGRRKPFAGRL